LRQNLCAKIALKSVTLHFYQKNEFFYKNLIYDRE